MSEFIKIQCPETSIFINKSEIVYGQISDGICLIVLKNAERFELGEVMNINQLEESLGFAKGAFKLRLFDE